MTLKVWRKIRTETAAPCIHSGGMTCKHVTFKNMNDSLVFTFP
jgi:hypothetical protein